MVKEADTAPLLPTTQAGKTTSEDSFTVDDALAHIGYGRFQFSLLFILGFAWFSDAQEVLVLTFLGADVKCEWNLTDAEMSTIAMVVFVGMGVGAYLWGNMSNLFGRKLSAIVSSATLVLFGFLTTFAPNYWALVLCRGIVGLGCGSSITIFTMYSEFLPPDKRGQFLSLYQMAWAVGGVVTAGMAWLVMPAFGWRGLVLAATAAPAFLLSMMFFAPESARYLVLIGKEQQAIEVLEYIAKVNRSSMPQGSFKQIMREHERMNEKWEKFKKQIHSLFEAPLQYVTPSIWLMSFVAGLSYYSIVMLTTSIHTDEDEEDDSCVGDHVEFSSGDYLAVLYDAAAEIPGLLLGVVTLEYFGRLKSLLFGYFTCALFVLLLLVSEETTVVLFFARLTVAFLFMVLLAFTVEIYPSSCRPFAASVAFVFSRTGAAIAPFLAQALYNACGLHVVASILGIILLTAGTFTFTFPYDTTKGAMLETAEEMRAAMLSTNSQS